MARQPTWRIRRAWTVEFRTVWKVTEWILGIALAVAVIVGVFMASAAMAGLPLLASIAVAAVLGVVQLIDWLLSPVKGAAKAYSGGRPKSTGLMWRLFVRYPAWLVAAPTYAVIWPVEATIRLGARSWPVAATADAECYRVPVRGLLTSRTMLRTAREESVRLGRPVSLLAALDGAQRQHDGGRTGVQGRHNADAARA